MPKIRIRRFSRSSTRGVLARETRAVSAIEYALLVGTIAVAVAAGLASFSTEVTTFFTKVTDAFKDDILTKIP